MNSATSQRMSTTSATSVAQINAFFEHYGSTFAALAAGKRCDLEVLLQFYSAPFRYIGSDFHMILRNSEDIIGPNGLGGEVARLRHMGYEGSTLDKCDIKVLNERVALVTTGGARRRHRRS